MKHKRNDSSEQVILSAWREQVTETARDPLSRQQLLFHERELLPRFAAQYGTLRALPRQTRRHLRASARLTNSTVSGNTAGADGGGVCNQSTLYLTHTTVSGNKAGSRGGGVFDAYTGRVTDLFLERSLISGNTASSGREILIGSTYVNVTAANFNLFGHAGLTNAQALVGFTPGTTDITATSNGNRPTKLGAILRTGLAKNGGLTSTHALVAGQPGGRCCERRHLPAADHGSAPG